jgi:hypothetical protein
MGAEAIAWTYRLSEFLSVIVAMVTCPYAYVLFLLIFITLLFKFKTNTIGKGATKPVLFCPSACNSELCKIRITTTIIIIPAINSATGSVARSLAE